MSSVSHIAGANVAEGIDAVASAACVFDLADTLARLVQLHVLIDSRVDFGGRHGD
jgi:hypothetical protein